MWSGRPDDENGGDFTAETTLTPQWDELEVTDFDAVERDAVVVAVDAGVEHVVRVQTRGGSGVASAEATFGAWRATLDDATTDYTNLPIPSRVEEWLIQLWPSS